jgi:hypothetical protein
MTTSYQEPVVRTEQNFNTGAAITRSMLGWGVVAGPLYLTVGVIKALTTEGFRFDSHALSLLMIAEGGWIQRTNLIVAGVLTAVAGLAFGRTIGRTLAVLILIASVCMIGAAIFPPDPVAGFPAGTEPAVTISGILHLAFGAIQFAVLGAAAIAVSRWIRRRGDLTAARLSLIAGVVIIAGFVGGAALSAMPGGVALLWVAVVATFGWLAVTSVYLWRTVPHPDCR